MTEDNVSPITVPSNYAGACESIQMKQDHLLNLSKNSSHISGSSLFTLKYGVLPCVLTEGLIDDSTDSSSDDDASSASDEPKRNRQRKQQPIYHMTRLVKSNEILLNNYDQTFLFFAVFYAFSPTNTN